MNIIVVNMLERILHVFMFSELNLNAIKLSKSAVDSLCQLAKTSCLSGLMLGATSMGAVSKFCIFIPFQFPGGFS